MEIKTRTYLVDSYKKEFYAKTTTIISDYSKQATFTFGGKDSNCITIAINDLDSDRAYIDRIEYNESCVKDGSLEQGEGTFQMIKTGLYAFSLFFPTIKILTLKDDSHIYCMKGSKIYKLNLAYDYILKYNRTWYEKQFNAILPEPYMSEYRKSLEILDKPLDSFEFMKLRAPFLLPYESEYKSSVSIRDFIQKLRTLYKDQYCFKVGPWLTDYLLLFNINNFKDQWMIHTDLLTSSEDFGMKEITGTFGGGKKTRKNKIQKRKNFSLVSSHISKSFLGVYDQF